jgi:hypothetical protein
MRLVRDDLARKAIEALRAAAEWPYHAIFLFVRSYQCFAVASGAVTHADLFLILKDDANLKNLGSVALQRTDDVYDGHLEWESDGTYFARTHTGKSLPADLDALLRSEIDRLMKVTP